MDGGRGVWTVDDDPKYDEPYEISIQKMNTFDLGTETYHISISLVKYTSLAVDTDCKSFTPDLYSSNLCFMPSISRRYD